MDVRVRKAEPEVRMGSSLRFLIGSLRISSNITHFRRFEDVTGSKTPFLAGFRPRNWRLYELYGAK